MKKSIIIIFLFLLILIPPISSWNILVYNPIFGFSHAKFFSKLIDILVENGHQVTSLQPFHVDLENTENLIKNKKSVKIINYYPENFQQIKELQDFDYSIFWDTIFERNPVLDAIVFSQAITKCFNNTASQLIKDIQLQNSLKSQNFDVMLYEPFDLTGVYLANLLNISTIPVLTQVRYEFIELLFGSPSTLGYIPWGSSTHPENNILDQIKNTIWYYCIGAKMHWIFSYQKSNLEAAIGEELPKWEIFLPNAPLLFANSNPYLDFAVASTKNIVGIGGITMNLDRRYDSEKLPEEYESILNEREATVLISFGSVVRSFEMPEHFKSGMITMFHNLPNITFIWKYEIDDVDLRLPKNVHLKKWVPQPALLSDERLKLFVTHGGLGSTMEVAYTGKPSILVPTFGDQHLNSMMLAGHGGALVYNKYDLPDGEKLTETVKNLLEDSKYKENAKKLLTVLETAPYDPKKVFLENLDFAIRFPEHRSFRPAPSSFLVLYSLLVIVILIFVLIVLFITVLLVRRVLATRKKQKFD